MPMRDFIFCDVFAFIFSDATPYATSLDSRSYHHLLRRTSFSLSPLISPPEMNDCRKSALMFFFLSKFTGELVPMRLL